MYFKKREGKNMEFCPICKKYAVSYNSYRKATMCLADGCTYEKIDENSYARLESINGQLVKVKVNKGDEHVVNKEILQTFRT